MEIYLVPQGRLGNALFRYFASIVFIISNQYTHKIGNTKQQQKIIINDKIFDQIILSNGFNQYINKNIELCGYFQYDSIYLQNKPKLIAYMKQNINDLLITDGNTEIIKKYSHNQVKFKCGDIINSPPNFNKYYKTVIHLRLEDFVKYNLYIKSDKIIDVLKNIDLTNACLLLKEPNTEFEKTYVNNIKSVYPNIKIESNSVIEDFHIMKNAEILVCSLSTLSWCAALLSDKLHTCYIPDWNHKTPGIGSHTRFKKPIENTIFYSI